MAVVRCKRRSHERLDYSSRGPVAKRALVATLMLEVTVIRAFSGRALWLCCKPPERISKEIFAGAVQTHEAWSLVLKPL